MARVVIGLSGGVDSSVAAYLLKRQGHEVIGLFMINWHDTTGTLEGDCPWHDDRTFAELVAKRLDIPLHVADLSEHYRKRVVDYMFAEYERGRTPNPDVLCNREIKFDVFLKEAFRLGADYVATGHYCRKDETTAPDGRTVYRLLAGSDPDKDQSYFLCQLSQEQLRYALFPVGGLLKPEVRRIAAEQRLATAKRKDSQGICFVGKVDLPVFLQQKLAARTGNVHEILPRGRNTPTGRTFVPRPPLRRAARVPPSGRAVRRNPRTARRPAIGAALCPTVCPPHFRPRNGSPPSPRPRNGPKRTTPCPPAHFRRRRLPAYIAAGPDRRSSPDGSEPPRPGRLPPPNSRRWPNRGTTRSATAKRSARTTAPTSTPSASARGSASAAARSRSSCWRPTWCRT